MHYYVQDPETFRGRRVAILGGGDSAVDWALMLADIADEVYLVHRRTRFRALEANVSRLNETQVQQVTPFLPARLIGDQGQVQQLLVEEVRGDQVRQLAVDDVIVSYGFSTSMSGIKHWGLEIDRQRIQVDDHLRTNRPGIYAVGDIALYPGKTRNLISGFGEVPRLIGQVMKDLNQEVNLDY